MLNLLKHLIQWLDYETSQRRKLPEEVLEGRQLVNILIVPDDVAYRSHTIAASNADIVISRDGQVLKDRDGDTWVKVITEGHRSLTKQADTLELARYVAVSPTEIREALNEAINAQLWGSSQDVELTIDYRDQDGLLTTRRIRPKRIRVDAGRERVLAFDLDKQLPRSFTIASIERVERDDA